MAEDPQARTRRRFVRRQWRRRWLSWRYLVVAGVVVVLAAIALWALFFSSWLSVGTVEVEGANADITAAQVRQAAAVPLGGPLLTADLATIRSRVLTILPAVQSVEVTRHWPDTVVITVTERVPVAVFRNGRALHALDAEGNVFLTLDKAPKALPLVESTTEDSDALAQGAQVAAALPASLAAKVDHLQVDSPDRIVLVLNSGRSVVWGSASESAVKAQVLTALMKAEPDAKAFDVSVPGSPVAR